jgi:hypothetical protein
MDTTREEVYGYRVSKTASKRTLGRSSNRTPGIEDGTALHRHLPAWERSCKFRGNRYTKKEAVGAASWGGLSS